MPDAATAARAQLAPQWRNADKPMLAMHTLTMALLGMLCLMSIFAGRAAHAQPAEVIVGSYVNKVQDLNFRENHYTVDFYVWFRWKAQGR
jgi:hypothetical protein